jgi:hypothetical protein
MRTSRVQQGIQPDSTQAEILLPQTSEEGQHAELAEKTSKAGQGLQRSLESRQPGEGKGSQEESC